MADEPPVNLDEQRKKRAGGSGGGGSGQQRHRWPGGETKDGNVKPNLANAREALTLLKYEFRFNLFTSQYLMARDDRGWVIDDKIALMLRVEVEQRYHFDPDKHMRDAMRSLCLQNQFHPVLKYFDGNKWDDVQRMDGWMSKAFGVERSPYTDAVGNLFLLAAVRRVKKPGCKFDTVPVFEGRQGVGKSKALKILAIRPEWFSDQELLAASTKEQMEEMEGIWIHELSELEGMTSGRAGIAKIKSFLSRGVEGARMSYGYFKERRPRQCVFAGTTNETNYLRDTTGNRRIWPIETGFIDLDWLRGNVDQLWAEAVVREAMLLDIDEALELPSELWAAAEQIQNERMGFEPWVDQIAIRLPERKRWFSTEVATALDIPVERQNGLVWMRIKTAMHKNGYLGPKLIRKDDRVGSGYVPTEEALGDETPPADAPDPAKASSSPPADPDTPF